MRIVHYQMFPDWPCVLITIFVWIIIFNIKWSIFLCGYTFKYRFPKHKCTFSPIVLYCSKDNNKQFFLHIFLDFFSRVSSLLSSSSLLSYSGNVLLKIHSGRVSGTWDGRAHLKRQAPVYTRQAGDTRVSATVALHGPTDKQTLSTNTEKH